MLPISKCFLLVVALVAFCAALPSPVEEKEDKPSYIINNSNVYINCNIYTNSAECKDSNSQSATDRITEKYNGDVQNKIDPVENGDDDANDLPQDEDEAMPEIDRYSGMEKHGDLWSTVVRGRDQFCSMCLAIISRQEVIDDFRKEAKLALYETEDLFSYRTSKVFPDIIKEIVKRKRELKIGIDEPVPVEDGQDFCSSIVRQTRLSRAKTAYNFAQSLRGKLGDLYTKNFNFYTEYIQNLEDDPHFMQCESSGSDELAQLRKIFGMVVDGTSGIDNL